MNSITLLDVVAKKTVFVTNFVVIQHSYNIINELLCTRFSYTKYEACFKILLSRKDQ